VLSQSLTRAAFQLLGDPCASAGPISAAVDDVAIALEADRDARGPWRHFQIDRPGAPIGAGASVWLQYTVKTRGASAVVPIVLPAATLETAEGARGARVSIAVRWNGPHGAVRVVMPRLEPSPTPDLWQASMLAIPSRVRIDTSGDGAGSACDHRAAGPTGGLGWRFVIFVATMAIWVPAYLWWSGRQWPADS